jgi:hypothetical protein
VMTRVLGLQAQHTSTFLEIPSWCTGLYSNEDPRYNSRSSTHARIIMDCFDSIIKRFVDVYYDTHLSAEPIVQHFLHDVHRYGYPTSIYRNDLTKVEWSQLLKKIIALGVYHSCEHLNVTAIFKEVGIPTVYTEFPYRIRTPPTNPMKNRLVDRWQQFLFRKNPFVTGVTGELPSYTGLTELAAETNQLHQELTNKVHVIKASVNLPEGSFNFSIVN